MRADLRQEARERLLVVAHRGTAGGNIPCNTLAAYGISLAQGADMIETDVEMSRDGKLVLFHPGMERAHLNHDTRLRDMDYAAIRELRYVNQDRVPTQFGINTLDELFEELRGRCYINIDKFWGHPVEIAEAIRRHGIAEQILVKSAPSEEVLRVLEETAPDLAYMPVVSGTHPMHEELLRRPVRYVGAEVLFRDDAAEVASPAFIERMHRDGCIVWVNSIVYDYRAVIAGAHTDDTALTGNPELGWGWLADRGFDLIQTDWPGMLIAYLKNRKN